MKPLRVGIVVESTGLPLRRAVAEAAKMASEGVQADAAGDLHPDRITDTGRREFHNLLRSYGQDLAALHAPLRHGLDTADLVVSRTALEDLQSRLYCLQAAIEDVDRDLALSAEPADVAEALRGLLENARPLADAWIEPRVGE